MRVLVANRGEIAVRLIQGLTELEIESVAIHTAKDRLHARCATRAVELTSAADFMNGQLIISIAQENQCNAIVPGYGFLSESAEFAKSCEESGVTFIGPSSKVLAALGDKSSAKNIAKSLNVPILPSAEVKTAEDVVQFAERVKYPVMIKALDGGGGKGIRIVRTQGEVDNLLQEARLESPSKQVFVEKAALDGFKHIEVQILGDGKDVLAIFERECSLQRKFQKLIEIAPSTLSRHEIEPILEAARLMAKHVRYMGLGTFEFLVNHNEFYFMECNPRIQVEHTVTEQITGIDLVHCLIKVVMMGTSVKTITLDPPSKFSIQCRLNAENSMTFTASRGTVQSCVLPSGSGIRVDSILSQAHDVYEASDEYDSLLAKVICTSSSYALALAKSKFALSSTQINGIDTNRALLLGLLTSEIMNRPEMIDIQTLGRAGVMDTLVKAGQKFEQPKVEPALPVITAVPTLLKKNDQFSITIPGTSKTIKIEKILKNNFPNHLSAQVLLDGISQKVVLEKSTGSISHKKADPLNKGHIGLPFAGVLLEILVEPGDQVDEGETIAIFRQGKMELDVRSQNSGIVVEVADIKEGEDVGTGALVAVVQSDTKARL